MARCITISLAVSALLCGVAMLTFLIDYHTDVPWLQPSLTHPIDVIQDEHDDFTAPAAAAPVTVPTATLDDGDETSNPLAPSFAPSLSDPGYPAGGNDCPGGVYIFATPGRDANGFELTQLDEPVRVLRAAIPGSIFLRTPYLHTSDSMIDEIGAGQEVLQTAIEDFVAACPDVPLVLLGYSEGACITMDTLCGASSPQYLPSEPISSRYRTNIIATVVMGDETRSAGEPYNRGTCGQDGTVARSKPDMCEPFASTMRSYCDAADPLCCNGGTDIAAHHAYPDLYTHDMVNFVLDKYHDFITGRQ